MYLETQDILAAAGMPAYEVSNHARAGAESLHNLIYWRQGDWAAVGPGAHGRLTIGQSRFATEAHRAPGEWLAALEGKGTGESLRDALPAEDRALEYLLMSMRLSEGMEIARYEHLSAARLPEERIADLTSLGLVIREEGRIRATDQGRPVLNGILRELAA